MRQFEPVFEFQAGDAGKFLVCTDQDCIQGQRVRVAWGPIVRFGHLKKFGQTWHNTHDLEWTVTFVWTSKSDYIRQSSLPVGDGLGSSASAFRPERSCICART